MSEAAGLSGPDPTGSPLAAEPTTAPAPAGGETSSGAEPATSEASDANRRRRRRGSRGGKGRKRPDATTTDGPADGNETAPTADDGPTSGRTDDTARPAPSRARAKAAERNPEELPERASEGRVRDPEVAERALVRRPQIGDSRPAPRVGDTRPGSPPRPRVGDSRPAPAEPDKRARRRRRRSPRTGSPAGRDGRPLTPVEAVSPGDFPLELDDETLEARRGRERKGRPVGRYMMCVNVRPQATQIAVLEGRALIEHYVYRPADDVTQIHGNIYLGRVQNVLPGMEAAFVDIGTPKNAVLYKGDVQFDREDVEESGPRRIEHVLRPRQLILCQVTKNPIGAKGARLTQEISLPGRFVVLVPNSSTYGISKRLPDDERKRLRQILDRVKPAEHGLIVRTAAENITADEIEHDVERLLHQWEQIEALAKRARMPTLLYREPDLAVRVIREEFNAEYRAVVIDDRTLFGEVSEYVAAVAPALADRAQLYDDESEPLPLFERFHVHEQLHKALDRKVWLPSGGSVIIEHTEALTVIDVNTGKNVGTSSLEETVFKNNLEAAVEIARQLRLRDIGGIIVVDFIDMEVAKNRDEVIRVFRDALARDKTRTQVFDISELGLVEMTRKRIGEGLLESFSGVCPECNGRGIVFDRTLLDEG
jgi:ribonuclease E